MDLMMTVDRIEGNIAIVEFAGIMVNLSVSALPAGTTEGTRLKVDLTRLPTESSDAQARLDRLRQNSPPGDSIDL
ncbi:MAG: hypothetical protein ACJAZO_003180 [Myxococcota bacterium]|jgi:hypothetical protein